MIEDDEIRPPKPGEELTIGRNLESLSVEALEDYIATLEAEIARVRADIQAKQGFLSDAEKFFKSN